MGTSVQKKSGAERKSLRMRRETESEVRKEEGMRWKEIQQDLYNCLIIEAGQRESRANACTKRNTHTHRGNYVHLHTSKTERVRSRPAAFRI